MKWACCANRTTLRRWPTPYVSCLPITQPTGACGHISNEPNCTIHRITSYRTCWFIHRLDRHPPGGACPCLMGHSSGVLHDVAPQTWPDYQPFCRGRRCDRLIPITWLVVPDFIIATHWPVRRLGVYRRPRRQGDELVLHGYFHSDDMPAPRTPKEWLVHAQVLPGRASFTSCPKRRRSSRLQSGLEVLSAINGRCGLCRPAWLMSEGTRQALRQLP